MQGVFKMAYNVEALAKKGTWNTNVQPLHQSFIVVQKLNLQRKAPFLPMQCYAFALFFRVDFKLVRNYFKNKSKIL
jgi:hypothetical protein